MSSHDVSLTATIAHARQLCNDLPARVEECLAAVAEDAISAIRDKEKIKKRELTLAEMENAAREITQQRFISDVLQGATRTQNRPSSRTPRTPRSSTSAAGPSARTFCTTVENGKKCTKVTSKHPHPEHCIYHCPDKIGDRSCTFCVSRLKKSENAKAKTRERRESTE